jgi:nitrate reductase delta subunit
MIATFRALSALLSYPTPELQEAADEIAAALRREGLVDPAALAPLLDDLAAGDIWDLQERYVLLFDRSRSLSLNLFEHVHGESRDRGGAMVDLLETYRAGGFELEGPELPDHLPVLLEFLSARPLAEGRAMLGDAAHILAALAERLRRRDSVYAGVFHALGGLAAEPADAEAAAALAAVPEDDPEDLAALDQAWEEATVTFGPDPDAGCPAARDMLARMAPPAAPQIAAQ